MEGNTSAPTRIFATTERTQYISCNSLYNLLQDSARSKLVIDIRTESDFEESCIRNSVHINFDRFEPEENNDLVTTKCYKLMWDENPMACSIKESKEWNYRGLMFKHIVICDSDDSGSCNVLFKLLLDEQKVDAANLYILQGGYTAFYQTYPFMCSSKGKA
jgi:rhodanese-related sulfurtransferase